MRRAASATLCLLTALSLATLPAARCHSLWASLSLVARSDVPGQRLTLYVDKPSFSRKCSLRSCGVCSELVLSRGLGTTQSLSTLSDRDTLTLHQQQIYTGLTHSCSAPNCIIKYAGQRNYYSPARCACEPVVPCESALFPNGTTRVRQRIPEWQVCLCAILSAVLQQLGERVRCQPPSTRESYSARRARSVGIVGLGIHIPRCIWKWFHRKPRMEHEPDRLRARQNYCRRNLQVQHWLVYICPSGRAPRAAAM